MTADDPEPTLGVVLQRLATRVSDTQAAVACALGTLATAVVALTAPGWWRVALATGSVAAFGGWIVAARSTLSPAAARLARGVTFTLGVAAAFVLGLSVLMALLGTWIS